MVSSRSTWFTTALLILSISCFSQAIDMWKDPQGKDVNLLIGQRLWMKCVLQGCRTKNCGSAIWWIKEGSSKIVSVGEIFQREKTTYDDVARYYCNAQYENTHYYGSFNVIIDGMYVLKNPDEYHVLVERGTNHQFWCELERSKLPPISWEKEGSDAELPEGKTFHLRNATYDDTGIYHCKGWYNRWFYASFNVKVEGGPYGVPKIIPQNAVVRAYETFNLTCNSSGIDRGIPESTKYIWTKDGEEINDENDAVLRYKPIQAGACQEYGCVIKNKYGCSQTGRTMLRVEGSPSIPLDLNVTHKTSKSVDISWNIEVKRCYKLEFEVQILKDLKLTKEIIYKDCRAEEDCKLRITELQPQSEYIIQMRSRIKGAKGQWLYSNYARKKATTLVRPAFKPMPAKVTETAIIISWKYERTRDEYLVQDTTEQVTVAVQYKKDGALNFTRYPEDENIPAENKIAHIDGSFDTSAIYLIVYEVYEGDQLTMETTADEIRPEETNSSIAVIVSVSVIGAVIAIGILSFLVGIWYHRRRQQKHDNGLHSSPSPQSNAGYEGNDLEVKRQENDYHARTFTTSK